MKTTLDWFIEIKIII